MEGNPQGQDEFSRDMKLLEVYKTQLNAMAQQEEMIRQMKAGEKDYAKFTLKYFSR